MTNGFNQKFKYLLKMSEQIKLSQEELDSIKQLQNQQQTLIGQFGQIEYQVQLLELQKDQLVETMGELQKEETKTTHLDRPAAAAESVRGKSVIRFEPILFGWPSSHGQIGRAHV